MCHLSVCHKQLKHLSEKYKWLPEASLSITFKKISLLSRVYITFKVTKVVVFVVEQTEM